MISTGDLSALPGVNDLRRLCRSLAMLDAILCPEWEYRYHSFDARWGATQEMASMRDGSGDDYFILFSGTGAVMKGFAHESAAWRQRSRRGVPLPGLFDRVPAEFAAFLDEPAFSIADSTFCLWRRSDDMAWRAGAVEGLEGDDPDGSAELLRLLDGNPETYRAWAEEYFEVSVAAASVTQVYGHVPLTEELVRALNPGLSLEEVAADAAEVGYPAGT